MTREEIKNKLYYVADTIKMNADKYANGEALENEDWVKAAKEFTACLNYLMNSHTGFKEVQGFLEKTDSGNPADPFSPQKPRNITVVEIPVNFTNDGRKYRVSERVIADFLELPENMRPASLLPTNEKPSATAANLVYKVGSVATIRPDKEHGLVAVVNVDSHRYLCGQTLKTLVLNGFTSDVTLCGEFEKGNDNELYLVRITHLAINVPPSFGSHKDNPESKESRRSPMFGELDIDNHEPRKIKCIRNDKNSGWWGDDKGELTVGEIYELTDIQVNNSYTLIWIKGTNTPFNSVLFAEVEEE